jgi:L-ascorbate metabolism protein UlaG (beta-lactamase superfamily)
MAFRSRFGNRNSRFVPTNVGTAARAGRIAILMLNHIAAAAFVVSSIVAAQVESARVEVFGPGVLSIGEVFRGTFTPDGGTFYFFKKTGGGGEDYRIYSSNRTATGWTTPAVVDLGGAFSDLYPAISRDGRRIVFSSYRPVPGQPGGKPNAHLWYADRTDDGWNAPVFMARTSTLGHYHSWVEFGFDGAIYFRRTTPDWKRNETMRARWTGTEYSSPEPYADVERWKGWRPDITVAGGCPGPGGRLVFLDVATTNPRTGRPASDIWVSVMRGDGWTEPAPFGAGINSDGYDVFPFVSPDGRDLYFVRDFTTFHRIPLTDALASIGATTDVRHVANSGMLVTVSGRRFLIDAPIRDGIPPYATSSAAERTLLEEARAPYDKVDAILITHWHEDHFSPEAVAAHLSNSPQTILISSPEVVDRVRRVAPGLPASRMRAVLPAPGTGEEVDVDGLPVHVLRVRHNPSRRLPEQHVGFLVGGSAPVLHVGDADPAADNFTVLKSLPTVDLALLPFWYLADGPNRRFVAESIRPRWIVAMHIPPRDAQKIAAALRAANVGAEVAVVPGSRLEIGR